MRKLSLLALFLGVVGVAACRSDSGDDQVTPDSSTTGQDDKIQDIQNDAMVSGTKVTLKGVVVTAVDAYGGKTGDFWVQEPEGGEYSGIHVFGAPLDQVAALQIGDVVDIKDAEKDEFVYQGTNGMGGFDPGFGITELKPVSGGVMTVTKTGASMVLQPTEVNALMIGGLTDYMARAAEWEKWEGVLITIKNVRAQNDQACVGSACNDPTLQKLTVTGDVVVESTLAAFPKDYMDPARIRKGDCLSSVTGVLDYFFDYLLLPRTTAEIGTGGTGCATEDTQTLCGDGIDNDGNSFTDCADNACVVGSTTCRMTYTIDQLQPSSMAITGNGVEIQNARVVAVSYNKLNMWVQINQQAAANEGMYVRGPSGSDLTTFAVGDRVNIIGRVLEYNDAAGGTETLTEIQAYSITAGTGGAQAPAPVLNQMASSLMMPANGEPMESVFVELKNVKVTATTGTAPYIATLAQAGGTTFKGGADIYKFVSADLNKCYSSIKGFWSYNVIDEVWYFLPRRATTSPTGALDATEAASTTACN